MGKFGSGDEAPSPWQNWLPGRRWAEAFLSAVAAGLLALHMLLKLGFGSLEGGLDAAALVLAALVLAPWIASIVSTVEFGGYKLTFLQQEMRTQKGEIEALKFMLLSLVSRHEIAHLTRLAEGGPFVIDKGRYRKQFERELRHLRDLGLIDSRPGKGVDIMYNDPGNEADIRAYFELTEDGRKYLKMRRKLEQPRPVAG
jgi:hypothetical protein